MTQWIIRTFVRNKDDVQNPTVRGAYGQVAGIVGILCNVLLCVAKMVAGMLAGSVAIMADAINNLTDASSSVITLLGFKLAGRPADAEHPYGHARLEYFSGLCVAVLIIIIGVELGQSSIAKILNPTDVTFTALTAIILLLSVGVKLWMATFNTTVGKLIQSTTLQATATDSRNDVISTLAVLASAVFAFLTNINLDGIVGLCVAVFIFYSGVTLVKDTVDPLLGQAPDEEFVRHIAKKVLSYEGVLGTHDLLVHDYGPGRRFGSVHVEMDSSQNVLECHELIDTIERDFLQNDQFHIVIHYDPVVTDDAQTNDAHALAKQVIAQISPELSMHDFRMVKGNEHTNLIFDVLRPHGFVLSEAKLKERIQTLVAQSEPGYFTVVTVDESYASVPRVSQEEL